MQLGYNIKKSLFLYNSTSQVKSVFANKDFFLSRINIYIYIYISVSKESVWIPQTPHSNHQNKSGLLFARC